MSRENYKSSVVASGDSNVVKRSPAISGRKNKTLAASVLAQSVQRNNIFRSISSVGKLLVESEKIFPGPSTIKR